MTNIGIVSPVVGVVRFWPAVIVPAVFAALFGPWVGGLGAGIGIFFADMLPPSHGIPLLSLTAGVPSNFLMFFLIGYLSKKELSAKQIRVGVGVIGAMALIMTYLLMSTLLSFDAALLFSAIFVLCAAVLVISEFKFPRWRSFMFASVVGQAAGAAWIGFSLWGYSQFLPLPLSLAPWNVNAPLFAGFFWLVWTFATEIPFIIVIDPPVLKACYSALPFVRPSENKSRSK